jgi:hypothetical protein
LGWVSFRALPPGGTLDYYFRNLDVTYDPVGGKLYLFRATPYPYSVNDVNGTHISCTGACPTGLPTFPMRGQIYYTQTNGATTQALSGTWTLLADGGGPSGWSAKACPTCACQPYP